MIKKVSHQAFTLKMKRYIAFLGYFLFISNSFLVIAESNQVERCVDEIVQTRKPSPVSCCTPGVSANPESASSIIDVSSGGTGRSSLDVNKLLAGGVTPTSPIQSIASGTAGQALVSGGAGVLPSFNVVGVAGGGTGVSSLTDHGVLIGQGLLPVAVTSAGTNGQLLIAATGADPDFANLTSTQQTIDFTTGSNSLAIDVNDSLQITSGFASWDGAAPYFDDTVIGEFTLLQSGMGYINTQPISWTAPQTVSGLVAGNTYYIYVDNTGTLQKTTTETEALHQNNIVLFEVLRDSTLPTSNQITVRENHPFGMPIIPYQYINQIIGVVIENFNAGANIVLNGTQKIQINGSDVLNDAGLETAIPDSGGLAVTWRQMFTNASGKWATNSVTDTFTGQWNNGGTVTALSAGDFAVYTLYVGKDNLNSSAALYVAVLDIAQYVSLVAANNAITAGTIAKSTAELQELQLAQLGYIIYEQATSSIVSVLIQKTTLGASVSSGGTNNASLVLTNTTTFDGILSVLDTNVQHALETIDDWGKFATNHGVLVGQGVNTPIVAVGPTATTGQVLQNNAASDPTYSTATYPSTTTINRILYSSANDVVGQITTANGGALVTGATGIPSILAAGATGIPLVSQGVGAQPAFSTVVVGGGGTGQTTFTANEVILSGTTATGAFQQVTNTVAALPLVSTGAATAPAFSALTVPGGGIGLTSLTTYALLTGGTTATGNLQQLTTGNTNQVLISQGSGALPIWSSLAPTTVTVTLTADEIKALHATPISLIDAQGAGTVVAVTNCWVKLNYIAPAYTAGGTIQLAYDSVAGAGSTTPGTGASIIITAIASNTFVSQAANAIMGTINGGQALILPGTQPIENTRILITNPSVTEFATGNGTITIYVTYQVLPI